MGQLRRPKTKRKFFQWGGDHFSFFLSEAGAFSSSFRPPLEDEKKKNKSKKKSASL